MAFDFPNTPALNQTIVGPGGISYMWDGSKWLAQAQAQSFQQPFDYSVNVGRNYVHNPVMAIAQRGVGPFTSGYTLDRWFLAVTTDTASVVQGVFADADRAAIGDETAQFSLRNAFTGNAAVGAISFMQQNIENLYRTSNKTVIVSFWAWASSATLKLGINITQLFGTGGTPSGPVAALATGAAVTLSNSWARYSVVIPIPSVAGKTLGTNGDHSAALRFFYSSGATNNQVAGNIGVQAGTISLYGVQLEVAQPGQTQPTPLDRGGTPQQQLANCQRFYQTGSCQLTGYGSGTSVAYRAPWPVTMRAAPTVTPNFTVQTNVSSPSMGGAVDSYQIVAVATVAGGMNLAGTYTASADL